MAKEKVEMVKKKAEEKLRELREKLGENALDPEVMVKKLKEEIAKLLARE